MELSVLILSSALITFCVGPSVSQTCGQQKSTDLLNLGAQFRTTTTARPTSTTSRTTTSRTSTTRYPRQTSPNFHYSGRELEHESLQRLQGKPPKIVGGFEITDLTGGQLCWQVLIRLRFGARASYCGGTIVGASTVISAAHCFVNAETEERATVIGVQVGAIGRLTTGEFGQADFAADCGQSVEALTYTVHPDYDIVSSNNDLVVIVLRNPLDLTRRCICAACLESREPAIGETCVVSGFGQTQEAQQPIERLKWLPVQVRENRRENCLFEPGTNADLFVCAGVVPNEDACRGDSGGPLICFDNVRTNSYYLAGTVSFGPVDPCGSGQGGQYTKTRAYFDWIIANSAGTLRAI